MLTEIFLKRVVILRPLSFVGAVILSATKTSSFRISIPKRATQPLLLQQNKKDNFDNSRRSLFSSFISKGSLIGAEIFGTGSSRSISTFSGSPLAFALAGTGVENKHFFSGPRHPSSFEKTKLPLNFLTTSAFTSSSHNMSPSDEGVVVANATDVTNKATKQDKDVVNDDDDPYIWLEEVESDESLNFAREMNDKCLKTLGDPKTSGTGTYNSTLEILESNDRIPFASKFGTNDDGDDILFNFWKDSDHPKGIWRKTTLNQYKSINSNNKNKNDIWTTVLDVDALGEKEGVSWVWKGARPLPRRRDVDVEGDLVTRALVMLSRGGADATIVREFDFITNDFVKEEDGGFHLPEAKTRVSYRSRNVVTVGTDFGDGTNSLTDSGYPRIIKEWIRGTPLEEARTVFEGVATDVSVSAYTDDQRFRDGPIYDIRCRALTFYTSKYWVRTILFEHLLEENDPRRLALSEESTSSEEEFVEVDVQEDAEIDFYSNMMLVNLRSDWTVGMDESAKTYKKGSLLAVDYKMFTDLGKDNVSFQILFEPTERTALETYTTTKNYLLLTTMDNVKSKLIFFKLINEEGEDGTSTTKKFIPAGGDTEAKILAPGVRPYDAYDSDLFWYSAFGYLQPTTLSLADAAKDVSSDKSSTTQSKGKEEDQPYYVIEHLQSLPAQFDASPYMAEQRMAMSKDGTQVPYFCIRRKDAPMDGDTPTILYGYGGFEISLTPHYIASVGKSWLDRGGAFVEANIRGGGEFGPSWHQAALKENRNKSYEDMIAVAEDLCHVVNLCRPGTLAVRGGSNGGLLVGNMLVMRPDLFGAIHCAVPLLDMKRYHKLLAGASWMAEYGNPDEGDFEKYLHKYSPYHNIDEKNILDYPPILFTTSTRDDRVHPAHARKMVKKLSDVAEAKEKAASDGPLSAVGTPSRFSVHYYENIEGGHGGAADSKQSAFMTALAYDFMFDTLTKNIKKDQ